MTVISSLPKNNNTERKFIMAIEIKSKEREAVKNVVNTFGCVREDTLRKYLSLINTTRSSEDAIIKAVIATTPFERNRTRKLTSFITRGSLARSISFSAADAFDAYVLLLQEHISNSENPENAIREAELVTVSRARYPYDFVASVGEYVYLIMSFNMKDSVRKILHHNKSEKNAHEMLVIVVPNGYGKEEIEGINVEGLYRLAKVNNIESQELNETVAECAISPVLGKDR